jgi:hypothetical protein
LGEEAGWGRQQEKFTQRHGDTEKNAIQVGSEGLFATSRQPQKEIFTAETPRKTKVKSKPEGTEMAESTER